MNITSIGRVGGMLLVLAKRQEQGVLRVAISDRSAGSGTFLDRRGGDSCRAVSYLAFPWGGIVCQSGDRLLGVGLGGRVFRFGPFEGAVAREAQQGTWTERA